ncbi:uncharacterized protein RAG0_11762 [Rhynchosporium agropyri]|uniref:Uncharacterized protein n=1 Tax=Rhynchosporium agropyri TaxID=914238 RepID=A0A1E1L5N6_9HELO|nr:uncharacterized protein RAG0_11762 [Rhynchosporium agropyri]
MEYFRILQNFRYATSTQSFRTRYRTDLGQTLLAVLLAMYPAGSPAGSSLSFPPEARSIVRAKWKRSRRSSNWWCVWSSWRRSTISTPDRMQATPTPANTVPSNA